MNVVLPLAGSLVVDASSALPSLSFGGGQERLHHRFVAQAALTPDAVAVMHAGRQVSYRELDRRSNRIAHLLRSHGARPGELVGVCLPRSPELLAALVAVLKTGAAYVPLDPAYPRERLEVMLADCRPTIVIAEAGAPTVEGVLVTLDGNPALDAAPATPLLDTAASHADPSALACVFYTSGSTGRPKGVMLGHTATRFIGWAEHTFDPAAFARVAATTSICFDPSMFEIFATLSLGGTVVLKRDLLEPFTADERPTLLNGVPTAFAQLVRENRIPDSVRVINVGGERLSASLARAIHRHAGDIRLWNHYGPTETTICASVALVAADVDADPPIGRPIAGAVFHVLDQSLQPVPAGVSGELHIGGPGVALGYLNQPALTAEQFLPDPFLAGGRMYRTGDMVRTTDNGDLVFLGRKGRQIKLRGFRIELDEIEAVLSRLTGIEAAAVQASLAPDGQVDGIEAVLVPTGSSTDAWTLGRLRRSLRDSLPRHMLPNRLVVVPALLLTPSGKIDRQALLQLDRPEPSRLGQADPWMPPLTEAILTVFRDLLRQPTLGEHDDVFDHGADSLLAMDAMLRIEALSGEEAPLQLLAKEATAAGLAGLLTRRKAMLATPDQGGQAIVLQPDGNAPPLFCLAESAAQPLQALALAYHLGRERPVHALVPYRDQATPDAWPADHLAALAATPPNQPVLLLAANTAAPAAAALADRLHADGRQVVLVLVDPVVQPDTRTLWQRARDRLRRIATVPDASTHSATAPFRTILVSTASVATGRQHRPTGTLDRITLPSIGDPLREPAVFLLADALRTRLPSVPPPSASTLTPPFVAAPSLPQLETLRERS